MQPIRILSHLPFVLGVGFSLVAATPAAHSAGSAKTTPVAGKEPGLLANWRFDEGEGDVASDSSGNGNDGDICDVDWVKGEFGVALRFSGSRSYVRVPEIVGLDGGDALTIEAWVLWEAAGRYPNIISGGKWNPGGFLVFVKDHSCSFRLGRPGNAPWQEGKDWRETSAPLVPRFELGRWYHLAATFERPVLRTYLNGEPVATVTWDFPVGYAGELLIGNWRGDVSHTGLIDEVRIYDRALSPQEIRAACERDVKKRTATAAGAKPYEKIAQTAEAGPPAVTLENSHVKLMMDRRFRVTGLVHKATGEDYLAKSVPFVTIKKGGRRYPPSSCSYQDGHLVVEFGNSGVTATLKVRCEEQYFVFEILSVSADEVEELTLLDLVVKPSKYVSNMSGQAADDEFAVCLRCLNLQASPSVRGKPAHLTAVCSRKHGLKGAKAALVACPAEELRPVLKELVEREDPGYSALGGPFALDAHANRCSYLFAGGLSESNVDGWIELARTACIPIVHLSGWYRTRGHYEPRKNLFPDGRASLKAVLDKIHDAGLMAGMHTLTGCIAPGDPFTSPVPDKRLAKDRVFTLAESVSETADVIPLLENPTGLHTIWAYASRGNVVQIGDELIQYSGLAEEPPYGLTNCTRGAFGTKAQAHGKAATVAHLYVRYSFQPDENSALVDDVAECIANTVNECGFDLIYHDGTEGMPAGRYGSSKMRMAIFNKITRPVRVESSSSGLHHCWPFHSCVGAWDLPHWGLKRFVDIHCRSNVRYRKSSLMPAQLGWWGIFGPSGSHDAEWPDEVEYLCCKALGHDMSLSFQGLRPSGRPPNARQDEYLTMIGRYEKLRLSEYFSESMKEKLRVPGDEFQLIQSSDGEWQFLPTVYQGKKVIGADDGSSAWTVNHRFDAQRPGIRIQALYGAAPYDGPESMLLADFGEQQEFKVVKTAGEVTCRITPSFAQVKAGASSACYTAKSSRTERRGAWAYVLKEFSPPIDIRQFGAMGMWIHGDGKGEILNFQLTNLPHYWEGGQTCSEHYVTVDFIGWRYIELLLRERDAERHGDYAWPYRPIYGIYRAGLHRECVTKLTIYYNNLPPGEEVKCYISPIKALPAVKRKLVNPSLTVGDERVVFPVTLESGQYIECDSLSGCELRDARGAVIREVTPKGDVLMLTQGENAVDFACETLAGQAFRAQVTLITRGSVLRGVASDKADLKRRLRHIDQYFPVCDQDGKLNLIREESRTIRRLDGKDNVWTVSNGGKETQEILKLRIQVGPEMPGREYENGLKLEDFEDLAPYREQGRNEAYVIGPKKRGFAKEGVSQTLASAAQEDAARADGAYAVFQATSSLADRSGWAAMVKTFSPPLDLSSMKAIGLWVKGDAGGTYLKVQLRNAQGGHHDYYIMLDFSSWRYFELVRPAVGELDRSKVECLVFYLVGLPTKASTTCCIDGVRALRAVQSRQVVNPRIIAGGKTLAFPVTLKNGGTLTLGRDGDCRAVDARGDLSPVEASGEMPKLTPGTNELVFECASALANEVKLAIVRE